MNPLNYLGLAIFISGAIFYAIRHFGMEAIDFDVFGTGITNEANAKLMDAIMEYSSFVFLLYIPVLGLSGYLSLNQQNYNLPEYMVGSGYVLAHMSNLLFLPAMFVIIWFPEHYMRYSLLSMLFMFKYSGWAFSRLGKYGLWSSLLRAMAYLMLAFIGYMAISIGLNILLLITGQISLADFQPVEK